MLFGSLMSLRQSDAIRALVTTKSSVRASASLHAYAYGVAGSVTPWKIIAGAPKKPPPSVRQKYTNRPSVRRIRDRGINIHFHLPRAPRYPCCCRPARRCICCSSTLPLRNNSIWRYNWAPRPSCWNIIGKRNFTCLKCILNLMLPDPLRWNEDLIQYIFSPHDVDALNVRICSIVGANFVACHGVKSRCLLVWSA